MSVEGYWFTGSGIVTSLIRNATLEYPQRGAARSQSNGRRKFSTQPSEDEIRLLGTRYVEDPNGVPLPPPGKSKKPFNPGPRPVNRISNARTSRPVPAQGRTRNTGFELQTPSAHTNRFKREFEGSHFQEGGSAQKRPKTEKGQPKSREVIEIDNTDDNTHARKRPFPPHESSGQRFGNDISSASGNEGVAEYRGVDDMVAWRPPTSSKMGRHTPPNSKFDDDTFMRNATNERQKRMSEGTLTIKPKLNHTSTEMKSVEIRGSNVDGAQYAPDKGGKRTRDRDAQASERHRDSSGYESPDELQGGTTIGKSSSRSPRSTIVPQPVASPQPCSMPLSNLPPAKFTKTQKESEPKNLKKGRKGKEREVLREFNLQVFRLGDFRFDEITHPDGGALTIGDSNISIWARKSESDTRFEIPIGSIIKLEHGASPSSKVRLPLRRTGDSRSNVDLEFTSEKEKSDFTQSIKDCSLGLKDFVKESGWMDNLFLKSANETSTSHETGSKRPSPGSKKPEREISIKPDTRKRPKLTESLQDEGGKVQEIPEEPASVRSGRRRDIANVDDQDEQTRLELTDQNRPKTRSAGLEVLNNFNSQGSLLHTHFEARKTRSTTSRNQGTIKLSGDEKPVSPPKVVEPMLEWSEALVYPRVGKRKAEVATHDLERLRGREFLNDNLVGFYMRFLEHHLECTNPDMAKRIYMFNSYFFANLTKAPKGPTGINYDNVSKWTRLVDIFSHDYIVVPINENAHWYVAIICNLPQLKRRLESDELEAPASENGKIDPVTVDTDGQKSSIPRSEPNTGPDDVDKKDDPKKDTSSSDGDERHTRKDLALLTLSDQKEGVHSAEAGSEKEDWPEDDENPSSSAPNHHHKFQLDEEEVNRPENAPPSSPLADKGSSKNTKKSTRKSTGASRKYDVKQPIIITLDSLGFTRSPTVSILREYVRAEAKEKRSMEVGRKEILGMTARGIPEQPNFSDCGLYLLAYLEKFAQDPDTFIEKLLRKELDREDWPKMQSRPLRNQLREFLINLHDVQEDTTKTDLEKDEMVNSRPLEILLKPRVKTTNRRSRDPAPGPSARNSPGALEKDQTKAGQTTTNGPMNDPGTPRKEPSSPPKETKDPVIQEVPGTPTQQSQPTGFTEDYESAELQVPGTPGAQAAERASASAETPYVRQASVIQETPSPKRRSARHIHTHGKQSPRQSPSRPAETTGGDEQKEPGGFFSSFVDGVKSYARK